MKPQYYQKQESGTKTRDRSLLYPHTTTLMANKKQKSESKKQKTQKSTPKKKNPSNGMQSNSRSNLHFQYIRNLCIQLIFDIVFF